MNMYLKWLLVIVFSSYTLSTNAKECEPFDTCTISFYHLIPSPGKYENVIIRIVGVAKNVDDKWFLFPSIDAARYNLYEQSIEVNLTNAEVKTALKTGQYAYIQGIFTQAHDNSIPEIIGVIDKEVKVTRLDPSHY